MNVDVKAPLTEIIFWGSSLTSPNSKGWFFLNAGIVIGSEGNLKRVKPISELLDIDREIGIPYVFDSRLFNSQAWSRKLELPWVVSCIGPPEDLSVLDVGSGASALPIFLSRHGARVVSVDPESVRGLPDGSVSRVRAALPHLPFRDGAFDVVSCVSVLEHLGGFFDEYLTELCRVARRRVVLTFDAAFGPFSLTGLSPFELRALAKMLDKPLMRPTDRLGPSGAERRILGPHLGVCLVYIDRPEGGWRHLRLSRGRRFLIRLHRATHSEYMRKTGLRLWRRIARHG